MDMKLPLKVNPDYESVLFGGPPSASANESLEFLALFLEENPLITHKKYSANYLDHVAKVSGKTPQLRSSGPFTNWWGAMEDPAKERVLNSKLTSTAFMLREQPDYEAFILEGPKDRSEINFALPWLIKDPFTMAGRGFRKITKLEDIVKQKNNQPLIVEPFLNRIYDFSHFVYLSGETICYQNLVDEKFQYRGTVLLDWRSLNIEDLAFAHEVSGAEWERFKQVLGKLKKHYLDLSSGLDHQLGFSVDSFIHRRDEELQIRAVSEVNFRRTMGEVAYQLARKYAGEKRWVSLRLEKSFQGRGGFEKLKEMIESNFPAGEVLLLSPGDTRFEILLLLANNGGEGNRISAELEILLANA